MTRDERRKLEAVPLPAGWEIGVNPGHWRHKAMVAEVYAHQGEFACSADERGIDGSHAMFADAADKALGLASRTWGDLERKRDDE